MKQHNTPEDRGKKRGLTRRTLILIVVVGALLVMCLCGAVLAALQRGDSMETPEATAPTPDYMVAEKAAAITELAPVDTQAPTDAPQPTDTTIPTAVPSTDTAVPPTDTPAPPPTPIQGLVPPGTYLVGTDIEPGIYVGQAGQGVFDSCYWGRLSGLGGTLEDLLANENSVGLYYMEVLPSDKALETACELRAVDHVPARETLLTVLPPGMYLVGRDIGPGMYRGVAGEDVLGSCYWARLSGVSGELDEVLANDNATGQYYIEVQPGDFALEVSCEVEKVE